MHRQSEYYVVFNELDAVYSQGLRTTSSTKLYDHITDILGRQPSRRLRLGIYRPSVAHDFATIVKRVFPLYEGANDYQARWSLPSIRVFWEEVKLICDGLEKKDKLQTKGRLSLDLHVACHAHKCEDEELHARLWKLYGEYEVKGNEAVEVSALSNHRALSIHSRVHSLVC